MPDRLGVVPNPESQRLRQDNREIEGGSDLRNFHTRNWQTCFSLSGSGPGALDSQFDRLHFFVQHQPPSLIAQSAIGESGGFADPH